MSPNPSSTIEPLTHSPSVVCREGARPFEPAAGTATRFLQSLGRSSRHPAPAKVFCSRELEAGLASYVRREMARGGAGGAVAFPSDDALRERARQIMGMQKTSCDDPVLLERFKASVLGAGGDGLEATTGAASGGVGALFSPGEVADLAAVTAAGVSSDPLASDALLAATLPAGGMDMDMDMDFHFTEQEMNDILQDVSPETLNPSPANSGSAGGITGLDFAL